MSAGTNCTVAACASVSAVPSGTDTGGVPGRPSSSYTKVPCAAAGPAVMVTNVSVPSVSVPASGTPIAVSSVGVMLLGVATGGLLAPMIKVSVEVSVAVGVPVPSFTV